MSIYGQTSAVKDILSLPCAGVNEMDVGFSKTFNKMYYFVDIGERGVRWGKGFSPAG
jgi:hypothetical protein